MGNILRASLNCAFVLFLFVPLVFFAISPMKKVSVVEKRPLDPFPVISAESFSLKKFTKEFEDFWDDHFGLREKLIFFNAQVFRKIFNKSAVRQVIQGENGWLFLNLQSSVYDYLGMSSPSEEILDTWSTTLENRDEWLKELGINYLVFPVPNKINIYSEHLPRRYTVARKSDNTALKSLINHLQTKSSFSGIVDLNTLFLQEKDNQQLYFKTDTHWTRQGAYLAYAELIKELNRWYPEMKPIPYSSLKFRDALKRGDLAHMVGNSLNEQYQDMDIMGACSSPMFNLPGHNPKETRRIPQVTTCDRAKLTAVITYDSFGSFLFPFYSEHFKRVIYVSRHDTVWLKKLLKRERPDVFIHQRTAREMHTVLNDYWGLDEKMSGKR